jgi:signal transduction histidine kinase
MWAAVALTVCVTVAHYTTDSHDVAYHNVFRRLYYVPVVLAAFGMGLKGGLGAAIVASLAYLPHAFLLEHHHDPAPAIDKVGEIVLYVVVGGLTGWLVERERVARARLERTLAERAELERELVRAGKLGALGELLAGVAHEIRNPLASIMGAAEGLERHVPEQGRARRLVALQMRELERLDRVVSNFLTFARTGPPASSSFALDELVGEIVDLASHQPDHGEFVVDESLAGETMFADRDQVSQIALNLTLNAIQARGDAPFRVTFLYRAREVAGRVHDGLGVRDEGVGVAPGLEEKIFEPFVTTRDSGSGLGLSTSSRLAQAHGGFLELGEDPEGTTFWLYMPRRSRT